MCVIERESLRHREGEKQSHLLWIESLPCSKLIGKYNSSFCQKCLLTKNFMPHTQTESVKI